MTDENLPHCIEVGEPRYCAVFGSPIAHSLSPVLHNAAYRALGLDSWQYTKRGVTEATFEQTIRSFDRSWAGVSATMPLKRTVMPYGTASNAWVDVLQVANTIVFDWNQPNSYREGLPAMKLYNTDVHGIVYAFATAQQRPFTFAYDTDFASMAAYNRTGKAIILGNGNTAKSAVAACLAMKNPAIRSITVAARHPRLDDGIDSILAACGVDIPIQRIELSQAVQELAQADIVISTLPAHAADSLADELLSSYKNHDLTAHGTLLDVVYDPRPTELMQAYATAGGKVIGGDQMLLYQAVLQVCAMTGYPLQSAHDIVSPMSQALQEAL